MNNHKEALAILEPMHKDFESYMFKPEVGGYYVDRLIYETFETYFHVIPKESYEPHNCNMVDFKPKYYIPTESQFDDAIDAFNDEQEWYCIMQRQPDKRFEIFRMEDKTNISCLVFEANYTTDRPSRILAKAKICAEIFKIKQEAK